MEYKQIDALMSCSSKQEFVLKCEIFNRGSFTIDDFQHMVSYIGDCPDFTDILCDVISETTLFDGVLSETDYLIDYYIAMMRYGSVIDEKRYRHFIALEQLELNPPSLESNLLRKLCKTIADKIEKIFGKDIYHVSNFRNLRCGK